MRCRIANGLACLATLVTLATCDIFTSTAHLQHLLYLERHMVEVMHNYLENTERKLSYVRGYLDSFYESYNDVLNGNASITADQLVENPIHSFHLVKRLSVDWDMLKGAMHPNDWKPVLQLTEQYEGLMPKEADLHGAAMALVVLQGTYKLNIEDFSKGDIQGLKSGIGLTARDLLYLGKKAFNEGNYGHAIQWLQQALAQSQSETEKTATDDEIQPFLTAAIEVHDELFERNDINLLNYDTLGHPVGQGNSKKVTFELTTHKPNLSNNMTNREESENYMAICRGEKLRTLKIESMLNCRLETQGNPYLILRPARTEQISWDPYLVQIHDLITDRQADIMRETAEPKLSRSRVQGPNGSEIVTYIRTSENAWLGPTDHPVVAEVYKIVEAVTGLSTDVFHSHAEMVQIANYGMGGHYEPHYDYLLRDKTPEELEIVRPEELDSGDRTATLMFYLSDVTRGGATAFPKIGAGVWPRKGSAVFWYNLRKNGSENPFTLHGACPVLHGSKWVANFWIREKGQAFRRRCDLDPNL